MATRLTAGRSIDNTVVLWDAISRSPTATLVGHTDAVRSVAYSADGLPSRVEVLTEQCGYGMPAQERQKICSKDTGSIRCVAYAPNRRTLAAKAGDGTVVLWATVTGKHRATLEGHTHIVDSVAYSPAGGILASGCDDHTVLLWDLTWTVNTKSTQIVG